VAKLTAVVERKRAAARRAVEGESGQKGETKSKGGRPKKLAGFGKCDRPGQVLSFQPEEPKGSFFLLSSFNYF